jgi:hypothetical protein
MIELIDNTLIFRFPDVHEDAVCKIDFQRTLRIPDDNREYPLPPGLGSFPMEHVADHSARLPEAWSKHGGVLLPMYQAEAMWINFSRGMNSYPFAVKIAAGKINAVTGGEWSNELSDKPQDYVVLPNQHWLDGFCVKKGLIRQFVAIPLGQSYTAEEQISGVAEHGGLQIIVYPMKRERYEAILSQRQHVPVIKFCKIKQESGISVLMGLAAGGLMHQDIYEDEFGCDAWDMTTSSRCFVHILNSNQWKLATGNDAPSKPPSAADYTKAGLPWFEYYDDKLEALNGSKSLAGLDSVAAMGEKLGDKPLPENEAVEPAKVVSLGSDLFYVDDGKW